MDIVASSELQEPALNASWRFDEKTNINVAVFNANNKGYWATLDYANYGDPRFLSVTLRTRF